MKNKGLITGTFIDEITYDIPSSNWGEKEWKKEFENMKDIGIDTLIFIRGGFEDKSIYPSKFVGTEGRSDFAGFVMQEAQKHGMSVFVGVYISNLDWNDGDADGEIRKNKIFIDEFFSRYGSCPAFKGWYIPHETFCMEKNITKVFKGIAAICKEKAPDKPVLISPFFKTHITCLNGETPLTPEEYYQEWDKIFAECGENIDIFACQDGTAPMSQMTEYFMATKRLCEKYNIRHWVNTETFERDVRTMYYPIPFEVLKEKLEKHKEYAEKIITFEFSHFLSPQSIYPSARNLNKRYKEFYGL